MDIDALLHEEDEQTSTRELPVLGLDEQGRVAQFVDAPTDVFGIEVGSLECLRARLLVVDPNDDGSTTRVREANGIARDVPA